MANDPSVHPVMVALDAAIHALLFKSRRRHELQPRLLGISLNFRNGWGAVALFWGYNATEQTLMFRIT
jgi:hypothetical protein